jgi:sugar phosphate permease
VQGTFGVAPQEQGLASGLVNTSLQIGGAVSLAIITAVLNSSNESTQQNQLLPNMHTAMAIVAGLALLGVLATLIHLLNSSRRKQKDKEKNDGFNQTNRRFLKNNFLNWI